MSKPDDTFLGRWSRKKREPEVEIDPDEALANEKPELPDDLSDAELLERLDLPDPDQLKEGDDFAAFMNKAVPDHLRRRALRKLWLSNPTFANLDGLVDYGEDYTDAATVPEVLNTAYKVGRGFLRDILEEKPEDEPDEELENDAPVALADVTAEEVVEVHEVEAGASEEDTPQIVLAEVDVPRYQPRQRMVFSTD